MKKKIDPVIARVYVTHWVTQDGRILHPDEIDPDHCKKIIEMVCRQARKYMLNEALKILSYAGNRDTPDGASAAASREAENLLQDSDDQEAQLEYASKKWPVIKLLVERSKKHA